MTLLGEGEGKNDCWLYVLRPRERGGKRGKIALMTVHFCFRYFFKTLCSLVASILLHLEMPLNNFKSV